MSARRSCTLANRLRSERRIGSLSSNGVEHAGEQGSRRAAVDEPEEDPRAFAVFDDEAGIDEQLEVTRHPRLGLAEDLGQVGDGELGTSEQGHDPQPRLFPDRLQRIEHHSDRRHPRIVHQLHKDIYMFTTRPDGRRAGDHVYAVRVPSERRWASQASGIDSNITTVATTVTRGTLFGRREVVEDPLRQGLHGRTRT